MHAWKTSFLSFLGIAYLQGRLLFVLGRVSSTKSSRNQFEMEEWRCWCNWRFGMFSVWFLFETKHPWPRWFFWGKFFQNGAFRFLQVKCTLDFFVNVIVVGLSLNLWYPMVIWDGTLNEMDNSRPEGCNKEDENAAIRINQVISWWWKWMGAGCDFSYIYTSIIGGFKYVFIFAPKIGEDFQFD